MASINDPPTAAGPIPPEAHAETYFATVDEQIDESIGRVGAELQKLGDSWQGDAADYFNHVVETWHTAYAGLFGDLYTSKPGLLGYIAQLMGIEWYDHTIPVTRYGLPIQGTYEIKFNGLMPAYQVTLPNGQTVVSLGHASQSVHPGTLLNRVPASEIYGTGSQPAGTALNRVPASEIYGTG